MSERPIDPDSLKIDMSKEEPKPAEAQKGKEAGEAFKEAVGKVVERAEGEIIRKFEESPDPECNLAYHRLWHTRDDMRRTHVILEALGANERTMLLGKLAAAAHDVVQKWRSEDGITEVEIDGKPTKAPRKMLVRLFGENEASSAEWAVEQMRKINEGANQEIFTKKDEEIVTEAILATIPLFEGEAAITQTHLYKESHIVAAALALADLGEAGMGAPSTFIHGSCALFREENLDIGRDIRSKEPIPEEKEEQYRQRILKYLKWQKTFLEERKRIFNERDISAIPKGKREAVRDLFSSFDRSIEMIEAVHEALKAMTFKDAAAYMGYGRPEEVKAAQKKVEAATKSEG